MATAPGCSKKTLLQPAAYQTAVLGTGSARVDCEAAVRFGWDRWLGERGAFVGMRGFGASGGADELYCYFGITAEAIVAQARRLVATPGSGRPLSA